MENAFGEVVELDFRRIQRSEPVEYSGTNPIPFFREVPAPTMDDPDAVRRVPVGSFQVPEGWREILLFFEYEPKKAAPMEFQLYGMDDSLRAFPEDTMVTFNASGVPLIARLGEDDMAIRDNANPPISYRRFLNSEFPVGFAAETGDGPKFVFENKMDFSPNERVILMLAPPRREGSIRLNVYSIHQSFEPDTSIEHSTAE